MVGILGRGYSILNRKVSESFKNVYTTTSAQQRLLQEQAVNLMAMVFGVNFAKISILQNIYIEPVDVYLVR